MEPPLPDEALLDDDDVVLPEKNANLIMGVCDMSSGQIPADT